MSPPILSFYETIVGPTAPTVAPSGGPRGSSKRAEAAAAATAAAGADSDGSDGEESVGEAKALSSFVDGAGIAHAYTSDRSMKLSLRWVVIAAWWLWLRLVW